MRFHVAGRETGKGRVRGDDKRKDTREERAAARQKTPYDFPIGLFNKRNFCLPSGSLFGVIPPWGAGRCHALKLSTMTFRTVAMSS
jgi:hypothetical protein